MGSQSQIWVSVKPAKAPDPEKRSCGRRYCCRSSFICLPKCIVHGTGGTLYEVSETYGYDVDSLPIRRVRRTPSLFNDREPIFLVCLEVVLESGVGSYSGAPVVPVIVLRLSRDGGKTWGAERTRSIGALWAYSQRIRWWRCGSGSDLVAEFVVTDPVPFRLMGCVATLRREEAA